MIQSSTDMHTFSWDAKLDQRSQSHQLPTSPPMEEVAKALPRRERMTEREESEEEEKERTARKGRGKGEVEKKREKENNFNIISMEL